MSGVNSVSSSASSVYGGQTDSVGSKDSTYTPQLDTIESAASGSTPAAATKWTPPSCLARYCTYVKHRIADFFDWVCSLFCSSKAVTMEQLEDVWGEHKALFEKDNLQERVENRYAGLKGSSKDDIHIYLADYIECREILSKIISIENRWREPYKSGAVLTERQLRADKRQRIELVTNLTIFAHSDLPKKATPAMMDKVKAYCLGKLTVTENGKVFCLVYRRAEVKLSYQLRAQFDALTEEIRKSSLEKFDPQIKELRKKVVERYEKVTLENLKEDSQAVHVLADCIALTEICIPLLAGQGDVSEESFTKRIESLEKRLAQPVLGEATKEMYEKVNEFDFTKMNIPLYICSEASESAIRERLKEVIAACKKPIGEANA